jgi:hypothetical protein
MAYSYTRFHIRERGESTPLNIIFLLPPLDQDVYNLLNMPHAQPKSTKEGMATTDRASIKPGDLEEHDDDAILRANGHEAVMPRQFNWISALGLGFSITNSWIGYLVSAAIATIPGIEG